MLLVFLTIISALTVSPVSGQGCKRRICYYDSTAMFRKAPEAQLLPKDIDTTLCSHIIYWASWLTDEGLTPSSPTDESNEYYVGGYEQFTGLKHGHADLKVLLALTILPNVSEDFCKMADSESSRSQFAAKTIHFLRTHRFDGIDIQFYVFSWKPVLTRTRIRISQVLESLRQAFDRHSSGSGRLLLSISVYGERILDDTVFSISKISQNVDWITLLTFDLFGYWYLVTGHHTPLYGDPSVPGGHSAKFNVDSAVRYWVDRGAPKNKIVVVLPLLGRQHDLSSSNTGVGAPIRGIITSKYTKTIDTPFYEICERRDYTSFVYHYLRDQGATYLVSGKHWISYDDIGSLKQKIEYIKAQGLGGFAVHSIDLDDFSGRFCSMGRFPLLTAANFVCTF